MRNLWIRFLLVVVGFELLYVAYLLAILGGPDTAYGPAGLTGAFLFMMAGGFLVGRSTHSHAALWGAAVGLGANVFYLLAVVVVVVGGSEARVASLTAELMTVAGVANFVLKILGGWLGGWASGRWTRPSGGELA